MPHPRRTVTLGLFSVVFGLSLLACNFVERQLGRPGPTPTEPPSATAPRRPTRTSRPTLSPAPTFSPTPRPPQRTPTPVTPTNTALVRPCEFVPGQATPANMPPVVLTFQPLPTYPRPALPTNTAVKDTVTQRQLRVYQDLWDAVNTEYVYPDFNGHDWKAIGARYRQLVLDGLTDDDFYSAMDGMITELGDDHSYYESPTAAKESDAAFAGQMDYAGVGVMVSSIPEADRGVIVSVFPNSPAAEAGLRPHDSILTVNGESLFDENGQRRDIIRGPEGTSVTLTVQRPGAGPFTLTLTRRRITGPQSIDYCLISTPRLGYLFLPGLDDDTLPKQVRAALNAFATAGPLDGLIIDNRQNGGGAENVLEEMLGFFAQGTLGHFVSPDEERPLKIHAEDIGGSQTLPLVVLVDADTASFGEVMSGLLQASGRAKVVGQTTYGNVETLWGYTFEDDSRAWIAHETFQPQGQPNGIWEKTGIVPNVFAPTRWDLFTEATDPALAVAVQLLQAGN